MQRPKNLKEGDLFRVIEKDSYFSVGEIITLREDDGSDYPHFWNADKSKSHCFNFCDLEPYKKSVRDAQIGDVVFDRSGSEYMVLERGQNTVVLSYDNNFKKADDNFHFDELEEHFTLKSEPELVDEKLAEAMKLLKEAGYKIVKE